MPRAFVFSIVIFLLFGCPPLHADSAPSTGEQGAIDIEKPLPGESPESEQKKEKKFHSSKISLISKSGYVFFAATKQRDRELPDRHGLLQTVGISLGNSGYIFEGDALFSFERPGADGGDSENLYALGSYLGMSFAWSGKRLIPSVGIGVRGAYLLGPGFEHAAEIYGRFPGALTWCVADKLALVFDIGIMYGITGVDRGKEGSFAWGSGFGIDASIGIRAP